MFRGISNTKFVSDVFFFFFFGLMLVEGTLRGIVCTRLLQTSWSVYKCIIGACLKQGRDVSTKICICSISAVCGT